MSQLIVSVPSRRLRRNDDEQDREGGSEHQLHGHRCGQVMTSQQSGALNQESDSAPLHELLADRHRHRGYSEHSPNTGSEGACEIDAPEEIDRKPERVAKTELSDGSSRFQTIG